MTTIQYVVATVFAIMVFVLLANLVVDLYARGAIRAAVDEGARAGAPIDGSPSQCAGRAREVLHGLLGARLRADVRITCGDEPGAVTARADASLPNWFGVLPDWSFTLVGTAVKEGER